jgi:hypothetical protein
MNQRLLSLGRQALQIPALKVGERLERLRRLKGGSKHLGGRGQSEVEPHSGAEHRRHVLVVPGFHPPLHHFEFGRRQYGEGVRTVLQCCGARDKRQGLPDRLLNTAS